MKLCKKCGEVKPLAEFNKNSAMVDGKSLYCRMCATKAVNASRNKETSMTKVERFFAKIIPVTESGCWLWEGAENPGGYGRFGWRGKTEQAHRVSWELHNGPIPDGLFALHKCDVPQCVNPRHLFLGTHQDNMTDMVNKGRHHHHLALGGRKLTKEDVLEIRKLARNTFKTEIAEQYGVSRQTVSYIVHRLAWRHI